MTNRIFFALCIFLLAPWNAKGQDLTLATPEEFRLELFDSFLRNHFMKAGSCLMHSEKNCYRIRMVTKDGFKDFDVILRVGSLEDDVIPDTPFQKHQFNRLPNGQILGDFSVEILITSESQFNRPADEDEFSTLWAIQTTLGGFRWRSDLGLNIAPLPIRPTNVNHFLVPSSVLSTEPSRLLSKIPLDQEIPGIEIFSRIVEGNYEFYIRNRSTRTLEIHYSESIEKINSREGSYEVHDQAIRFSTHDSLIYQIQLFNDSGLAVSGFVDAHIQDLTKNQNVYRLTLRIW